MGTTEERHGKAELLGEIEGAWTKLKEDLDGLTETQMTEIRDPEGWAVKDHLVHMAAWERSVVVFMHGKPRYMGLGISRELYNGGDDDEMNAAIQENRQGLSLSDAMSDFREVHSQLLGLLEPMSDADLYKANSDFQPDGSDERDERPIIGMIYSNTAEHFRDHQEWIMSLVSEESSNA